MSTMFHALIQFEIHFFNEIYSTNKIFCITKIQQKVPKNLFLHTNTKILTSTNKYYFEFKKLFPLYSTNKRPFFFKSPIKLSQNEQTV